MRKPKGAKLYSQVLTAFLISSPRWFELGGKAFWDSARPRSEIHSTTRRNRWNFVMDKIENEHQRSDFISILEEILKLYDEVLNTEISSTDQLKIDNTFANIDTKFKGVFQKISDYNNKHEKSEILEVIADVYKRLSHERIADAVLRAEERKERVRKASVFKLSESIRSALKKKINASKVILSALWTITKLDKDKVIKKYVYYYSFSLTSYWKTRIRAESATEIENFVYKTGKSVDKDLLNIRFKEEQILSLSSFWNIEEEEEKDNQEAIFANRFEEFRNFLSSYIDNLKSKDFGAPIYTGFALNPQDIHIWKLFRNYSVRFINAVENLDESKKSTIKEEFKKIFKTIMDAVYSKFKDLSDNIAPTAAIIEDANTEYIEEIGLFPYIGSKKKRSVRDMIISKFPEHNIYIEPMVGSGAIFVYKQPVSLAIINDINKLVYEIWEGIKDGTVNIKGIDKAYRTFIKKVPLLSKREVVKSSNIDRQEIEDMIKDIIEENGYDPNYIFVAAFSIRNDVFEAGRKRGLISPLPTESWIKSRYHLMRNAIENQETHIYNMDAIELLEMLRKNGFDREDVVMYIDPPYVSASPDVYSKSRKEEILELNRRIIEEVALWNNANIFISNYEPFLELAPDLFDVAAVLEVSRLLQAFSSKKKPPKVRDYLFVKKKTTL